MINTELSAETRTLADRLKEVTYGELIAYADLAELIGQSVTGSQAYILQSARKVALRESGAIFDVERGVGLVRLHPDDVHKVGTVGRHRIRRAAKRASKQIVSAQRHANSISPESQRKANAEISSLNLIEHIARDTLVQDAPTKEKPQTVAQTGLRFMQKIGALSQTTELDRRASLAAAE